jgi:uncharacterized HAD superfamily protein
MKHLRVGFDIDGVLADFVGGFTSLLHERRPDLSGLPYGTQEQREWEFRESGLGITEEDVAWGWEQVTQRSRWWEGLSSLMSWGERVRLAELCTQAEVFFITARYAGCEPVLYQTSQWLENQGLSHGGLVLAANKRKAADLLKLDYYIDDHRRNAEEVHTKAKCEAYLLARLYNAGANVPRLETLGEFLGIIDSRRAMGEGACQEGHTA